MRRSAAVLFEANAKRWIGAIRIRELPQRRVTDWALLRQIAPSTKGLIIDAGCGEGQTTRRLVSRCAGAQVIGYDASTKLIRAARQAHASGFYSVMSHSAAAARISEMSPKPSLIAFNFSLFTRDDFSSALSMLDSLENDGCLVIQTTPLARGRVRVYQESFRGWGGHWRRLTFERMSRSGIEAIAKRAGASACRFMDVSFNGKVVSTLVQVSRRLPCHRVTP